MWVRNLTFTSQKSFSTVRCRLSPTAAFAGSILKIKWPERISSKMLQERTNQETITQIICRRKWRWIGHSLRRPLNDITREALEWNPGGKRKVGRPRMTWRRPCEEEMKVCGQKWCQLKKIAENRTNWRCALVEALCSTRNCLINNFVTDCICVLVTIVRTLNG